jgi:hypothetical protein
MFEMFLAISHILGDQEDIVLKVLLVHAKFASLAEPSIAADVIADKRLLVVMDITVLFEVLG